MAGMNDIIMANPMGAIAQATQTAGAMDQLSRMRTQDQYQAQDRGIDAQARKQKLLQEAMAFAGKVAPEILSAPTPEEKNARYQQFRTLSGMQGFPVEMLPMQYSPEVERRLNIAAANALKTNAPTSKAFAPQPMVDASGKYTGMGVPVYDPNTGQATLRPLGGGQVMNPLDIAQAKENIDVGGYSRRRGIEADTAPDIARGGALGKGEGQQIRTDITNGIDAADSTANIRRGIELLGMVETGGFDAAALRAKQVFGIESGDEGELSNTLGKTVLSQLRATFGAAFTAKEGEQLSQIEAGFGKSPATNKRLLQRALTLAERAAYRGLDAAERAGDKRAADEIRRSLEFKFEMDEGGNIAGKSPAAPQQGGSAPATNAKGWTLHQDAQGNKAYVGPNGEVEEVQ